ncbi:MAG: hypothetical protein JSR41_05275 [Proteobacteria bacterium]|nr:hypothetical protein [Pseudomonadota bacterium]
MGRGKANATPLYGIHRRKYGWTVRVVRAGIRYERSFSDRAFGGDTQALEHAQYWRNSILVLHPPTSRRERAERPRARRVQTNSSELRAGVTAEMDRRGRLILWRAKTYLGPGTIMQKTFSIARWGNQAEAMAHQERERQLNLMQGLRHVHPAEELLRTGAGVQRDQPPSLIAAPEPADVLRSTNSSGYPGVVRRTSGERTYWTAQTTQGRRWVSRSFSIDKYGEEVALLLAVMERQAQRAAFDRVMQRRRR